MNIPTSSNSKDWAQAEKDYRLEELFEKERKYYFILRMVEKSIYGGVAASDDKGHFANISLRITPGFMSTLARMNEEIKIFTTKSQLVRCCLSLGAKLILRHYLEQDDLPRKSSDEFLKWKKIFITWDRISEIERWKKMQNQLQELSRDIDDPETKATVIEIGDLIEKRTDEAKRMGREKILREMPESLSSE